jgi:hypothetical protein
MKWVSGAFPRRRRSAQYDASDQESISRGDLATITRTSNSPLVEGAHATNPHSASTRARRERRGRSAQNAAPACAARAARRLHARVGRSGSVLTRLLLSGRAGQYHHYRARDRLVPVMAHAAMIPPATANADGRPVARDVALAKLVNQDDDFVGLMSDLSARYGRIGRRSGGADSNCLRG